jgi:tetratricopeptide (TPR) repeat protein
MHLLRLLTLLAPAVALGLAGCKDYVDIKTQGSVIPSTTANYRSLLNNTAVLEPTVSLPDITADDVDFADLALQNALPNFLARAYTWQPAFFDASESDQDWNTPYQAIYYTNTVAAEVLTSTGGTDADKQQLLAEAQVHRAAAYLALVNCYARAYTSATATTDLGVPLLLTPSINADLTRAPVQIIYSQIISDLQTAAPALPTTTPYTTQPSRAAAYALLARTYLLQGNYAQARQQADNALAIQSTLVDLNAYVSTAYPRRVSNPEIILSKTANATYTYVSSTTAPLRLSAGLLSLLGTTDLRYVLFTRPASSLSPTYTGRIFGMEQLTGEPRNLGPSVPEMLLIRAECQARQGDGAGAIATLNTLRVRRFRPANYVPLTTANAKTPLQLVLDERQRELFCRGFRWFDQKRLNQDPTQAQTESRAWLPTTSVVPAATYTLAPGTDRYLFPIPPIPRRLNPEIAPNP